MELIEILGIIFSILIIGKLIILFLLPQKYLDKVMHFYDNVNLNYIYYIYLGIASILIYLLYIDGYSFTEILVFTLIGMFLYGAVFIKILGDKISELLNSFGSYLNILKASWLYIIIMLFLCIMSLCEIFCNT